MLTSKQVQFIGVILIATLCASFNNFKPYFDDSWLAIQSDALPWLPDFEQVLQERMDQEHIPGLAYAIVNHQGVLTAKGFGVRNVETDAPVTPETLFHIGSTHKSMTAMLITTLVDDGLLDWDSPVTTWVPSFSFLDEQSSQKITMRHLLSMRAGIPADAEDLLYADSPAEDVPEIASEIRLIGEPGDGFEYSNLSASLAGYLGVIAAGGNAQSLYDGYAELLETRVLLPIGMDSATLSIHQAQANPNYAFSYTVSLLGKAQLSETYDVEGDALAPSGSLKANVVDMGNYISTQLNHGVAPNGNSVVSAENLAETWVPYLENYAMGWENIWYREMEIISHTGAYDDFASVIGFFPKFDLGFVVLLNSEEAGYDLVEEIPYLIADFLFDQ
jgi:CubicO group peptidase (beta-lactamase class C family)